MQMFPSCEFRIYLLFSTADQLNCSPRLFSSTQAWVTTCHPPSARPQCVDSTRTRTCKTQRALPLAGACSRRLLPTFFYRVHRCFVHHLITRSSLSNLEILRDIQRRRRCAALARPHLVCAQVCDVLYFLLKQNLCLLALIPLFLSARVDVAICMGLPPPSMIKSDWHALLLW